MGFEGMNPEFKIMRELAVREVVYCVGPKELKYFCERNDFKSANKDHKYLRFELIYWGFFSVKRPPPTHTGDIVCVTAGRRLLLSTRLIGRMSAREKRILGLGAWAVLAS